MKGFQDASKEFENEFKKEADRLEKTVAEPMKATLEKPKAISQGEGYANAPDKADEPTEAKIVEEAAAEETEVAEAAQPEEAQPTESQSA